MSKHLCYADGLSAGAKDERRRIQRAQREALWAIARLTIATSSQLVRDILTRAHGELEAALAIESATRPKKRTGR